MNHNGFTGWQQPHADLGLWEALEGLSIGGSFAHVVPSLLPYRKLPRRDESGRH
jgi:hypothetical protein